MTKAPQRSRVVCDEHNRAPLVTHLEEHVEALLLECRISDRENLVDQQDVCVDLNRYREGQPDVHARGVVLELQVLELAQFSEVDHRVVAGPSSRGERPSMIALMHHVVPRGQIDVEANAELDERRQPAVIRSVHVDAVDARRCTSAACSCRCRCARDAEELPLRDLKRDVAGPTGTSVVHAAHGMQSALLERLHALLWQSKRLADRIDYDRWGCWALPAMRRRLPTVDRSPRGRKRLDNISRAERTVRDTLDSSDRRPLRALPMNHDQAIAVEIAGYLSSAVGVGEAARLYTCALRAAGARCKRETCRFRAATV